MAAEPMQTKRQKFREALRSRIVRPFAEGLAQEKKGFTDRIKSFFRPKQEVTPAEPQKPMQNLREQFRRSLAITKDVQNTLSPFAPLKSAGRIIDRVIAPQIPESRPVLGETREQKTARLTQEAALAQRMADRANKPLRLAYETIKGLPEASIDVGKDVIQGTLRSGGMVGLTLAGVKDEFKPATPGIEKATKILFGEKPIRPIGGATRATTEELKGYGVPEGVAKVISPIGVIGSIALDFTGGGAEKQGIKQTAKAISKTKVASEIVDLLRPLVKQGGDEEINLLAREFVDVTDPKKAEEILTRYAQNPPVRPDSAPVSRETPEVAQDAIPKPKEAGTANKGALESLSDPVEGKVYYHGTTPENKASILQNGIDTSKNTKGIAEQPAAFYASTEKEAGMYGKDMVGIRVKQGEKVRTLSLSDQEWADTVGKSTNSKETSQWLDELRKRGYDAINHGDEIEILNPKKFDVFDPTVKANTPDYRYHETSPEALKKIQKEGMIPNEGQYGKGVYFSPNPKGGEASRTGVILRAKRGDLEKFKYDEFPDQGWTDKKVSPDILEFSKDGGKTWEPLISKKPEGVRTAVEEFDKRMAAEFEAGQKKIRQANQAIEEEIMMPKERVGIFGAVKRKLQPFKYTDPEVKSAFKEWEGKTINARQLANEEISKMPNLPKNLDEAFDVVKAYEKGEATPYTTEIKKVFDDLIEEARKRGVDVKYRENYIPHVYKQNSDEVIDKITKYLAEEKGLSMKEIENYIRGRALPEETSRRLKLSRFFEKERIFPTYEVAAKYGLTPKYKHPAQLAAYYREELEKTIANMDFMKKLVDDGKILKGVDAPTNWKYINAPSFQGYKAPEYLTNAIDNLFKMEAGQFNIRERITEIFANASKRFQEIALSGGIPLTNINFFSIGQTIKEMTRGNFKAVQAFLRSNFTKRSVRWFQENQPYMKMMAEEGINLGDNVASYTRTFDTLKDKLNPLKKETWTEFFGDKGTFDTLFNDKTFSSFMPMMHTQVFRDTYEQALKKGLSGTEARKLAGDMTKNIFGLVEEWGRSKGTKDALSAVFFAPRFRESIVNTLFNTGKSITTELRNPAFKNNRKLALGMITTFAAYDALNYKLNGHHMWENPSGRIFALRIPIKGGEEAVYIEFMPSFLAFARNMVQGVIATGKGDFREAGQKFGSLLSMPVKLVSEILSNKDYFGNKIYEDTDSLATKTAKAAAHFGLSIAHPFIKEFVKWMGWDKGKVPFAKTTPLAERKPLWQMLVTAAELPIKFGTAKSEETSKYYDELEKRARERTKENAQIRKKLEQIRALRDSGKRDEAQAMFDALTPEEREAVKRVSASDKATATRQRKVELYRVLLDIRKAKKGGNLDEANRLYAELSDDDKKLIQKVAEEHPEEK